MSSFPWLAKRRIPVAIRVLVTEPISTLSFFSKISFVSAFFKPIAPVVTISSLIVDHTAPVKFSFVTAFFNFPSKVSFSCTTERLDKNRSRFYGFHALWIKGFI